MAYLVAGMISTGAINSIFSKYQDMQCVENCTDPDPSTHILYEQPVWQTLQMFLGEMLCFLPVLYSALFSPHPNDNDTPQLSGTRTLLLCIPALCDLTGTTLMNIGLLYTPVSIYQMTRGAVVLFVGVLSVIFLHRRLWLYQWLSLLTVMLGVSLVGLSGSIIKDAVHQNNLSAAFAHLAPPDPTDKPHPTQVLVGILFVLFAQIFTATQFVVEEKILSRYSIAPLLAVAYEGLFGFLSILLLLLPLLSLPSLHLAARSPFFDLPRGWRQMLDTPAVLWSSAAIALSIACFNFFGLSVTTHVSATARSLCDTCRTLAIWIISLALGWETLLFPISLLQVLGFGLLVYGTFLFNDLVKAPPCFPHPAPIALPPDPAAPPASRADLLADTALLPADLGGAGFDVVPAGQDRAYAHPTSPTARSRSASRAGSRSASRAGTLARRGGGARAPQAEGAVEEGEA